MKNLEQRATRSELKGESRVVSPEVQREAVQHAKDTLKKADALLGGKTPRTGPERQLSAQRLRLATWMKRLSLLGAIAAGHAGLYAGANYAGDQLRGGITRFTDTVRSMGDIKPIQVEFTSPAEEIPESFAPEPAQVGIATPGGEAAIEITINDPGVDGGSETDSTVHEDNLTQTERQYRILNESALLIADELRQENYFGNPKTVDEFTREVRARLASMGITDEGSVETAQRIAVNTAREAINDLAARDIEGAMRMGRNVNAAFGGVDTYHLAVSHNRPDLAAELATEQIRNYRQNVRDIRNDHEYADDPEGRVDELNRTRRDLIRGVFPDQDGSHASDVVHHLGRNEREQVARALDEEIHQVQEYLNELGASESPTLQERLARLQSQRRLL